MGFLYLALIDASSINIVDEMNAAAGIRIQLRK